MGTIDILSIEPTLGFVVETDRGSLPFGLIHGESLVACAAWALGDAGVTLVDFDTPWPALTVSGERVAIHDVLCPMTPASFIAEAIVRSEETDAVVVGVRPVTDTVKELAAGAIGGTVDRDGLWQVASPLVLPAEAVAALGEGPGTTDFAAVVGLLAERGFTIETLEAPAEARRVATADEVRLLEAQTAQAAQGRSGL
ncbi:2-C-methyl-D-erythritol 4-phosphate cytidylyltransferase [Nocardioides sp.]|uniref:2-C-methyl-D-erythritol 4-phosphate cytidylyltransferase n=1 Tax=Nocardioides sp. TaxID=35761 RepID=UPI0026108122|nr:2-C-methyl-D-erythritol 4-phosphate cytidylyltransferase [Nocardioides sp.]